MENMPSGGGGYGEQYGEYAFWGGMENGMENMPSGGVWRTVWRICLLGGVWRTVWRICLLGGVWRTVWRIAFSGGGG